MAEEKAPQEESPPRHVPGSSLRPGSLVSQEELDALANALRQLVGRSGQGCGRVSLFDFRRPVMLSATQLRLLRKDAALFARALSRVLGSYLSAPARVEAGSVEVTTLEAFVRNLPPRPVVAVCRLAPGSPRALWEIAQAPALAAVELMLGATAPSPALHEPTAIEKALLLRFFDELLSTWRMASPYFSSLSPAVTEITSSLGPLDSTQAGQRVAHLRFSLALGGVSGGMNLALPVSLLRTLLTPKTPSGAPAQAPGIPAPDGAAPSMTQQASLGAAARQVPVELSVQLPALELPLSVLGALQAGQTLPLGLRSDCPLLLAVNGRRKFLGQSGLADGRLAVRITRLLD